jgi:hypothetical protein
MKNRSHHTDLCDMREMPEMGWLIGWVKHEICDDSLYLLYLLLLISKILADPSLPYDPLYMHVGLIFIFLGHPL